MRPMQGSPCGTEQVGQWSQDRGASPGRVAPLSVVKAGYSARYRICTGYAQLAQISKRCSTCIHVAAV